MRAVDVAGAMHCIPPPCQASQLQGACASLATPHAAAHGSTTCKHGFRLHTSPHTTSAHDISPRRCAAQPELIPTRPPCPQAPPAGLCRHWCGRTCQWRSRQRFSSCQWHSPSSPPRWAAGLWCTRWLLQICTFRVRKAHSLDALHAGCHTGPNTSCMSVHGTSPHLA